MKVPLPQTKEGRGLTNWVTASLREAILAGHFEPCEKLDQDLIAEELKVSRTPIREALKVLESEGFVEIRSYRGAYIAQVTRQDIQDVFDVRRLFEAEIVRQATPIIPDEVIAELETLMLSELKDNDISDGGHYFSVDAKFHDTLLNYCQNKLFLEILSNLNNRILRVRYFALRQPGPHLKKSFEEHLIIIDAMKKRDPELASKAMSDHLAKSALRIEEFIR